jgi:hypothetical protein
MPRLPEVLPLRKAPPLLPLPQRVPDHRAVPLPPRDHVFEPPRPLHAAQHEPVRTALAHEGGAVGVWGWGAGRGIGGRRGTGEGGGPEEDAEDAFLEGGLLDGFDGRGIGREAGGDGEGVGWGGSWGGHGGDDEAGRGDNTGDKVKPGNRREVESEAGVGYRTKACSEPEAGNRKWLIELIMNPSVFWASFCIIAADLYKSGGLDVSPFKKCDVVVSNDLQL